MSNKDNITITQYDVNIPVFEPEDYIVIELDNAIDLSFLGNNDNVYMELEVVRLTNIEREKRDLRPVLRNEVLSSSALLHTLDMAENSFISHTGSDGSDLRTRIDRVGYKNYLMVGENLAAGYFEPERVVKGWMDSPGHRANILRPEFNQIGVAYIQNNAPTQDRFGHVKCGYWTQHFGTMIDPLSIIGR